MAIVHGTRPTGTSSRSTGAVMSSYPHDATAQALRWAIRHADDTGDPVPCRGQQMIGPSLPAIRLLICNSCPLYLKRACAEFGIAVVSDPRSRQALIAGGRYLINAKDAEAFAADLAEAEPFSTAC